MKKVYEKPEIECILFSQEDIITTSGNQIYEDDWDLDVKGNSDIMQESV